MTPRTIILVLAALIATGATVFFAQSWLSSNRAQIEAQNAPVEEKKPETLVLVAKENLPAGRFLRPEHLAWQAWPDAPMPENYIRQGTVEIQDYTGAVVRRGITHGEPVTPERIVMPNDRGFMAAVLRPGMRAISMSISDVTGVAGFVLPGDYVDLLLTHQVSREGVEGEHTSHHVSETILESIRILAIDQVAADLPEGSAAVGKTATIEVTPRQAEAVTVAMNLGKLTLALRSLPKDLYQTAIGSSQPTTTLAAGGTDNEINSIGDVARIGETHLEEIRITGPDGEVIHAGVPTTETATEAAVTQPTQPVIGVDAEPESPVRGRTHTWDSQTSRLVPPIGGSGGKVDVLRGSSSETVKF